MLKNSCCDTQCNRNQTPITRPAQSKMSKVLETVLSISEKVCAIALIVFSAYTNITLFVPFFLVGFAIGLGQAFEDKKQGINTLATTSCSLGLMEKLLKIKLPRIVSLAVDAAVLVCHIDHHGTVFIPVIAISAGNWTGNMAFNSGSLLYKNIKKIPTPSQDMVPQT